jgi:hypothetical protein
MSPTAELRWVQPNTPALMPTLQQKWVQHHIPAGESSAPFEWRDVETVKETK